MAGKLDLLIELGINRLSAENLLRIFFGLDNSYRHLRDKVDGILQSNILLNSTHAEINEWNEIMQTFNGGDCVDITLTLTRKLEDEGILRQLFESDIQVEIGQGTESNLFFSERDNHAFLLLKNSSSQQLVLDAALQVICNIKDSNCTLRETTDYKGLMNIDRGTSRKIRLTDDIKTAETAIIGVTDDYKTAVSLGFHKSDNSPFFRLTSGGNESFLGLEEYNQTLVY